MATSGADEPTLIEIRLRLDLVDQALIEVLSERARPPYRTTGTALRDRCVHVAGG